MICEIQIRTKLQDAWAEFTHEVHSKVPAEFQADYETAIVDIASRLAAEDMSALTVRDILQRQAEKKEPEDFRNDWQRMRQYNNSIYPTARSGGDLVLGLRKYIPAQNA
jgi:putative GTP pyrophosphokinase